MPTVKALSEHTSILVTNTDESIDGADSGNLAYSAIGRRDYVAKTSSYTAVDDDDVINLSSASNQAITLPACASTRVGKTYTIRKGSNNGTAVNILTTGGNTINSGSYAQISSIGDHITVLNTGSEWLIINQHGWFNGRLFVNNASATVANTGTETTITPAGVGSTTLPASFFLAGTTVTIKASGYYGVTGSPVLVMRLLGGSAGTTEWGTTTNSPTGTNAGWSSELNLICRTAGASGTVFIQGWLMINNGTTTAMFVNTATETVDTTVANVLSLVADWSAASASNTITCTNFTITHNR